MGDAVVTLYLSTPVSSEEKRFHFENLVQKNLAQKIY